MSNMKRGDGRPPAARMLDVATRAGVALGTVSNVVNRPDQVNPDIRRRVEAAIDELGFVPNRTARALAVGTSRTIGFVIVDLGNSFFLDLARGAEREAAAAGYDTLLANSDLNEAKENRYLDLFQLENVAGILVAPSSDGLEHLQRIRRRGTRTVLINQRHTDEFCTVTIDNETGGYLAAKHLLELGRRRLAFAGADDDRSAVQDRLRGAMRAVREAQSSATLELLASGSLLSEDGRVLGQMIVDRADEYRPDGVIAAADLLARGIAQTILSEGRLRIPEDVAITGYDNNRASWDSEIPLTTIAQPGELAGEMATRLLLDELRDGEAHVHQSVVLPPALIVRSSTVR